MSDSGGYSNGKMPSVLPPCQKQAASISPTLAMAEYAEDYKTRRTIRLMLTGAAVWAALVLYLRQSLDAGNLSWLSAMGDVFWNAKFWVPHNITWIKHNKMPYEEGYYSRPVDALFSISMALIILSFRLFYARYIARPIGRMLKLKDKKIRPVLNPKLESFYARNFKPTNQVIQEACKVTRLDEHNVRNWFRKRRNFDKPTVIDKWCEGTFKFTYYFTIFWGALYMLWQKEWFHDTTKYSTQINVWKELHVMEWDVFCYYQIVLGFYWSLFISQFMDVRRKDFWQMFIHHIITIILLTTSFGGGWHRIGALVIVVHDFSDWTIEIPKNAHYVGGIDWLVNISFPLLWFGWIFSRLLYYPMYVISIPVFDAPYLMGYSCPYVLVASAMLTTLLIMHFFWFYYITMSAVNIIKGDAKDERSCSEAESESTEDDNTASALAKGDGDIAVNGKNKYNDVDISSLKGAGDAPTNNEGNKCNGDAATTVTVRQRQQHRPTA